MLKLLLVHGKRYIPLYIAKPAPNSTETFKARPGINMMIQNLLFKGVPLPELGSGNKIPNQCQANQTST